MRWWGLRLVDAGDIVAVELLGAFYGLVATIDDNGHLLFYGGWVDKGVLAVPVATFYDEGVPVVTGDLFGLVDKGAGAGF